jgi:molybdopterin synthase catalytic subunit
MASIRLSARPLSYRAACALLEGPGLGGVVVFAGRVRPDRGPEGQVVALDYDVHRGPALRALRELAALAERRYGARRIVLWHRVGRVPVDEVSVIVGAACGHRAEAFAAARFLIDELKATVPIWKAERARPARRRQRPPRPGRGRATG